MNRNRRLLFVLQILIFCLLSVGMSLKAQSDILVEGDFLSLYQFQWSSDSSRLVFFNSALGDSSPFAYLAHSSDPNWQYIETSTGIISEGSYIWPLQPELSSEEARIFPTDIYSYIHMSPDGNLLIYVQPEADEMFFDILIANRSTGEIITTGFKADYPMPPDNFRVDWSEDSHSALIAYTRWRGDFQLLHIAIPDFDNLATSAVREFSVLINNLLYTTTEGQEDKFLDMSSDGQDVLIIGRYVPELGSFYDSPAELILWHPYRDIAEILPIQLPVDRDLRASFSVSNDALFFVNGEGLFRHQLATNQLEPIPLGFDMTHIWHYSFSPSGEWLAVVKDNEFRLLNLLD